MTKLNMWISNFLDHLVYVTIDHSNQLPHSTTIVVNCFWLFYFCFQSITFSHFNHDSFMNSSQHSNILFSLHFRHNRGPFLLNMQSPFFFNFTFVTAFDKFFLPLSQYHKQKYLNSAIPKKVLSCNSHYLDRHDVPSLPDCTFAWDQMKSLWFGYSLGPKFFAIFADSVEFFPVLMSSPTTYPVLGSETSKIFMCHLFGLIGL